MAGEEGKLLLDDEARGFIKSYQDGRYEFVALVPDKGVKLSDYIATLSGERLLSILDNPINHPVESLMPKFEMKQSVDMQAALCQMGVTNAFDKADADFSGIGKPVDPSYNLCIGKIKQFNKIRVNERGTKAASFTGLSMKCLYSCITPKPFKVYLDRPFLYMIVDRRANLPLFIGVMQDVQKSVKAD